MKNYYIKHVLCFTFLAIIFSLYPHSANAQAWSQLGTGANNSVNAMIIYNSQLVAAGSFSVAGGQNVNHIATWNGTIWQPLGLGTNDDIYTLAILNGLLVAGGKFTTAGGISANRVAVWNGSIWSTFGTGFNGDVYALSMYNNDFLIAGGAFTTAGGGNAQHIAVWHGSWQPMGQGFDSSVNALAVFNTQLYAGGNFMFSGSNNIKRIAVWNGTAWLPLGLGVDDGNVYALRVYGSSLAVGGTFTTIGGSTVNRIARWNGSSWATVGSGFSGGVYSLFSSGTVLLAGGTFDFADFLPASKVAVYNGSGWSALGSGLSGSNAIAKAIALYGGRIVFGGFFSVAGGNSVSNIAAWGSPLGITPVEGNIPDKFSLQQNYPNPFNPMTNVRFQMPKAAFVKLIVFDIQGREVAILVNEELSPGTYEVSFDASGLAGGIYFYKIISGEFTQTKKMLLVK